MRKITTLLFIFILVLFFPDTVRSGIAFKNIEPTVFFQKQVRNEPLKQLVVISILNDSKEGDFEIRVSDNNHIIHTHYLKSIHVGESKNEIFIPDLKVPTTLEFKLLTGDGRELDKKMVEWKPQKKWTIYHVAYSHHDMGYADYFHLMRRDVRELGIELALEYCKLTDNWDKESQYRWTIETSEPLARWIRNAPTEKVEELVARIKEGRIELGAIHNSVNVEMLNAESLARLFYTPNRYVVDMLGIEPRKMALLDDVEGFPRSLPLYTKEAGLKYFFHGRNNGEDQMRPASFNAFYKWLSPDNDKDNMTWFQTTHYHCSVHAGDFAEGKMSVIQDILKKYEEKNWPLNCVMFKECWDFSLPVFDNSIIINSWNKKWEYPKVINSTMTMFFEDGTSQLKPENTFVFDKDAPNSWVDEHYADFKSTSQARLLSNKLVEVESFGSFASAAGAKGSTREDIWAGYNNLLNFDEHTMGAYSEGLVQAPVTLKNPEASLECYYETEYSMHGAFVTDAKRYIEKANGKVNQQFEELIKTNTDSTLAVFNPLAFDRTDVVHLKNITYDFQLIDNVTNATVPIQKLPDNSIIFIAHDIPSMGYKTYRIAKKSLPSISRLMEDKTKLENRFYKLQFDLKTGSISSILDKELNKELVDPKAEYKLGEYLYNYAEEKEKDFRIESASLSQSQGPVSDVMVADIKAKGVREMRQMIILYNDIKRIDFVVSMDKSPSMRRHEDYKSYTSWGKESVFFAFPFNVPEFTIRHDLPGTVVEPIAGQSEGSTTSHYGIQSFSDISGNNFGITLATAECGLIEYGYPRHSQLWVNESILKKPEKSYMFLYPMNNWFGTNIQVDQRGKTKMTWSISSHSGNWIDGRAYIKGEEISHPLYAIKLKNLNNPGKLPAGQVSFLRIDKENIVISTIKPAEINGHGYILRVNEVCGHKSDVTVTFPLLPKIDKAEETNLIEVDKGIPIKIVGNSLKFKMNGFGLKTIRFTGDSPLAQVQNLSLMAVADMQVDLKWKNNSGNVICYNIYRDAMPGFTPGLRNLVGRAETNGFSDRPATKSFGWGSKLEPNTTYYYKVSAVNSQNNEGPLSSEIKVVTSDPLLKNCAPSPVLGLRGYLVSNVGHNRFAAMWFHSNPESDIKCYRIFKSTKNGFKPEEADSFEDLDVSLVYKHTTPHGFKTVYRHLYEYDAQVYTDENVESGKTYYYKVLAIDKMGKSGLVSDEVSVTIEPDNFPDVQAQSTLESNIPFKALDGSDTPESSWISEKYGGGTKANPVDVWWIARFHDALKMKGLNIVTDIRDSIPVAEKYKVEYLYRGQWNAATSSFVSTERKVIVNFGEPKKIEGIRISVKGMDLPASSKADLGGFVRLSEVKMINEENKVVPIRQMAVEN